MCRTYGNALYISISVLLADYAKIQKFCEFDARLKAKRLKNGAWMLPLGSIFEVRRAFWRTEMFDGLKGGALIAQEPTKWPP